MTQCRGLSPCVSHTSCSWRRPPQVFHNISIWLTLVLAVQRYIYICQATRARHLCSIPRARRLVAGVLGAAFLHISPRLFDRVYSIQQGESGSCGPR